MGGSLGAAELRPGAAEAGGGTGGHPRLAGHHLWGLEGSHASRPPLPAGARSAPGQRAGGELGPGGGSLWVPGRFLGPLRCSLGGFPGPRGGFPEYLGVLLRSLRESLGPWGIHRVPGGAPWGSEGFIGSLGGIHRVLGSWRDSSGPWVGFSRSLGSLEGLLESLWRVIRCWGVPGEAP